eukprot:462458_1
MYNRNPNRKHPNEWTVDEVAAWLCSLENGKYVRYKAACIENEVDGDELKHLDDSALNEIGIKKYSHQKGILLAIQNLLNEHDDDDDTKDEVKTQSDNKDHRMNKPLDSRRMNRYANSKGKRLNLKSIDISNIREVLVFSIGIAEYDTDTGYGPLPDIFMDLRR